MARSSLTGKRFNLKNGSCELQKGPISVGSNRLSTAPQSQHQGEICSALRRLPRSRAPSKISPHTNGQRGHHDIFGLLDRCCEGTEILNQPGPPTAPFWVFQGNRGLEERMPSILPKQLASQEIYRVGETLSETVAA